MSICSICNEDYSGYGNNAEPVGRGRCCDLCNITAVIPRRLAKARLDRDITGVEAWVAINRERDLAASVAVLMAARAMLTALRAITDICEDDDQYPHHTTEARKAIAQAEAAGINALEV